MPSALESRLPWELGPLEGHLRAESLEPGIYFLCKGGFLMYVGQAERPEQRIAQHRVAGMPFDAVYGLACPRERRRKVEGWLIWRLTPPLNTKRPRTHLLDVMTWYPCLLPYLALSHMRSWLERHPWVTRVRVPVSAFQRWVAEMGQEATDRGAIVLHGRQRIVPTRAPV